MPSKATGLPMANQACIVCGTPATQSHVGQDVTRYDCPRCGVFALSCVANEDLPVLLEQHPIRRSLMSHALRRMQRPGRSRVPTIKSDELASFWQTERLPTPQKQADALILWIGDHQETPFARAKVERPALAAAIGLAISDDGDVQGFSWLDRELSPKKLYIYDPGTMPNPTIDLQLTMTGWERYGLLKKANIESRTAFMAMKFNDAELNRVVDECFRVAVRRAGFELRVLTDQQAAGLIDDQMRAAILASRFVIADLTHASRGAYWEAGYGEGLGLPVIYTCKESVWKDEQTHFDTNHLVTRTWDVADLKKAENELASTIRATLRAEAKQTDD
jgi:hypothetical protein